jgi:hypothetical protein
MYRLKRHLQEQVKATSGIVAPLIGRADLRRVECGPGADFRDLDLRLCLKQRLELLHLRREHRLLLLKVRVDCCLVLLRLLIEMGFQCFELRGLLQFGGVALGFGLLLRSV